MAISNLLTPPSNYGDWLSSFKPKATTGYPTAGQSPYVPPKAPGVVAPPKSTAPAAVSTAAPAPQPTNTAFTPAPASSAGQQVKGLLQAPPITGNTQTPSGATVNATTGGLVTPPPATATPPPTFGGLVGSLAQTAKSTNPAVDQGMQAYQQAVQNLSDFDKAYAAKVGGMETDRYIPLGDLTGREAALNRQAVAERAALQQAVNQQQQAIGFGQAQQSLTQQGLGTVAGLVSPVQVPYSNQFINPATGQPVSGGGAGSSLNDAVSFQVQKLRNGTATYNDAVNALSAYGQAGVNALQQAVGPDFNVSQSNTLGAQQGSIKPAFDYAKQALTNLQNAVGQLGIGQNTNIPIINSLTQAVSSGTGLGSTQVQAYKGAIAEARSAIQKVLASVQGGTPTDYVGQSNALLPDNATPNQIQAAIDTLNTLGTAKVGIYSNPGFSGTSQSTGPVNFNW